MTNPNNNSSNGSGLILGSKSIIIGIAVVIGLCLITFWAGSCNNTESWDTKYKAWNDSTKKTLAYADSLRNVTLRFQATADSTKKVAAQQTQQIAVTQSNVNILHETNREINNRLDSLMRVQFVKDSIAQSQGLSVGAVNPMLLVLCDTARKSLKKEVDSLHIQVNQLNGRDVNRLLQISSEHNSFVNEKQRADSLQTTLSHAPAPRKESKLFGLFHISPTTSFLIGTAAGLVGSVIISSHTP